jgi:hypothetical protein
MEAEGTELPLLRKAVKSTIIDFIMAMRAFTALMSPAFKALMPSTFTELMPSAFTVLMPRLLRR